MFRHARRYLTAVGGGASGRSAWSRSLRSRRHDHALFYICLSAAGWPRSAAGSFPSPLSVAGAPAPLLARRGAPAPPSSSPLPLVAPPDGAGGFGRAVVARGAPFFVGYRRHRPCALLAFRSHVRVPLPAGRVGALSRACCSFLASDTLRAPSSALCQRHRVRRVRRFRSVRTRVPLGGFRINCAFSTFLIFLEPFFSSATVFQKNKKK